MTKKGLDAWKERFYPIPAKETWQKNAIKHSLRKWLGLREKILKQYGLEVFAGGIWVKFKPGTHFPMSANTCSLCHHYFEPKREGNCCGQCPLKLSLGRSCDADGLQMSEYHEWIINRNPIPMIRALVKIWKESRK